MEKELVCKVPPPRPLRVLTSDRERRKHKEL